MDVTDSIEIERSDVTEERKSLPLASVLDKKSFLLEFQSPVRLLDEEKFDFDLSASPQTSPDKPLHLTLEKAVDVDDEVFFGPVGFAERCVSTKMEEEKKGEEVANMSPISPSQWAQIAKDAYYLAYLVKTESKTSRQGSQSQTSIEGESTCQSKEDNGTNKKKHTRKGTFTLDSSPFELLPIDVQNTLPVIDVDIDTPKLASSHGSQAQKEGDSKQEGKSSSARDAETEADKENQPVSSQGLNKKRLTTPKRRSGLCKSNLPGLPGKAIAESSLNVDEQKKGNTKSNVGSKIGRASLPKPATKINRLSMGPSSRLSLGNSRQPLGNMEQRRVSLGEKTEAVSSKLLVKAKHNAASSLKPASVPGEKAETNRRLSKRLSNVSIPKASKKETGNSSATVTRSSDGRASKLKPPAKATSGAVGETTNLDKTCTLSGSNAAGPVSERAEENKPVIKNPAAGKAAPGKSLLRAPSTRIPGKSVPLPSKPSLLVKPTDLKKLKPSKPVEKKAAGPLKATAPAQNPTANTTVTLEPALNTTQTLNKTQTLNTTRTLDIPQETPVKDDKKVKPKNLAASFLSPRASLGSTSEIVTSTPASNAKQGRRSFIPTPRSSRSGSWSSMPPPSPLPGRSGSVSSIGADSPFISKKVRSPKISLFKQAKLSVSEFSDINEHSPSALKPRNPRVLNTPNLPEKRISQWSPVRRLQPTSLDQAVTMCTKRIYSK